MRMTNLLEGLVFTVGFLVLCLVILFQRPPAIAAKLVPIPTRQPQQRPSLRP